MRQSIKATVTLRLFRRLQSVLLRLFRYPCEVCNARLFPWLSRCVGRGSFDVVCLIASRLCVQERLHMFRICRKSGSDSM